MRIYNDCLELMTEVLREVSEMGVIVSPNSMQNKVVKGDTNYQTKEVINYSYCLLTRGKESALFNGDSHMKDWAKAEFSERIDPSGMVNPGKAYLMRPIWEQFLVDIKGDGGKLFRRFDYSYNERIDPSIYLKKIIDEIRVNPDSRQLVLSIWDPTDVLAIGGKRRVPCSITYQFLVRGNKLNIVYNQRSADVANHFGNDVWLAWQLMNYVANETGRELGYLYHNITSLHCYRKDWDKLKTMVSDLEALSDDL